MRFVLGGLINNDHLGGELDKGEALLIYIYTPLLQYFFRFNLCRAVQPLRGLELQEKQEEKDEKLIGKVFRKNPNMKCVY